MRRLLAISGIALLARCAPVTARAALSGSRDDAATCTVTTLQSLGYVVVEADANEAIKAERELHAPSPFTGAADRDRVTVWFLTGERPEIQVIGETVHTPGFRRLGPRAPVTTGTPGRVIPSRAVRADVEAIARACAG